MRPWFLYVLALGCASSRPALVMLPTIPMPRDVEAVLGPAPEHKIPGGLKRYPDVPIDPGDCPGKPEGILVSEAVYADSLVCKLTRDRLEEEGRALRQLRAQENFAAQQAEQKYRERISELERSLVDAERRASVRLWIGIAVGAGGMLAATWAGSRATR